MSAPNPLHELFAVCAPGLEPVLDAELRALRMARVERQVGGVYFRGRMEDAWRANLESRTAVRILLRLARFEALEEGALYAGVQQIDWRRFLAPGKTLLVDARSRESALDHTLFIAQRVKDAIADQLRECTGERPTVDRDTPDVRVQLHLYRDRATLSLDTSGASLHKRGWRRHQGRAPLSETLAAGIVMLSGWDRRAPLIDPFCGSGTLLIEAALLAMDRAPGLFREHFGFEVLPGFERSRWEAMRNEAAARPTPKRKLVLRGSDINAGFIEGAAENLAGAGLEGRIELEVADARKFAPRKGWNACILTNPPYGERVGDVWELEPLFQSFGDRLRAHCAGYELTMLSGNPALTSCTGLPFQRLAELMNGALDCELLACSVG